MKNNLSKEKVFLSILTTVLCHAALMLIMLLMLVIDNNGSIKEYFSGGQNSVRILTASIALIILTCLLYFYFLIENRGVIAKCLKIVEIYFLFGVSLLLCTIISKYVAVVASPFLLFPLMAAMFFKRKDATFLTIIYALQLFIYNGYLLPTPESVTAEFAMTQRIASLITIFCGGTIGIFLLKNIKTRIACITVALVLLVPTLIINLVIYLLVYKDQGKMILETLLFGALDSVFSVVLFMCFLPIVEALFSELTAFRLRELTSDNAKLIKKLKQHALGTYNHSIVVAQLAEACATAIGEDSDLARAAAFYHDVGKLKNPEMFAENQNDYDLHKELTPELSVDIIRSHTKEGAKLIKRYHLPEFFANVAVEHHGTLPIKYFYAKALKMSDGELNVNNYSYPGPTPTTKIAAIIMIADASEAACRSLSDRSPEKVSSLVGAIVEERMNLEQFVDCDITMRELTIVTNTVINQLAGVYHSRVKYPKLVLSRK